MNNPLADSTRALLDSLDDDELEAARAAVRGATLEALGEELELEDELNMMKAAKFLSASDGLSSAEHSGLRLMMRKLGLPEALRPHVLDFELGELRAAHIGALANAGSREACIIFSGMIAIAGMDGLSDDELDSARAAGDALGLGPKIMALLIAEAKATISAVLRGDTASLEALAPIRRAILDLVDPR